MTRRRARRLRIEQNRLRRLMRVAPHFVTFRDPSTEVFGTEPDRLRGPERRRWSRQYGRLRLWREAGAAFAQTFAVVTAAIAHIMRTP